jgi:integrase
VTVYFDRARNRWTAEVNTPAGRRRARCMTELEARAAEASLQLQVTVLPAPVIPHGNAVPDSIEAMIRRHGSRIWSVKGGGRTPHAEDCASKCRIMDDLMGHPRLTAITTATVGDLVDRLIEDREVANGTINRYLSALHSLMKAAVEYGVDLRMPRFPWREEGGHRPRILQPSEQDLLIPLLIKHGGEDCADAARVFLATGARMSEIFNAQPSWLKPGWLIVPAERSKTRRERHIPLTPRAEEILRHRLPWARLNLRTFRYAWNKAREVMGLKEDPFFIPYLLRHTWATRAVSAGVDIRVIQEMLGHATIQTTIRYAKVEQKTLTDAALKVAAAFHQDAD